MNKILLLLTTVLFMAACGTSRKSGNNADATITEKYWKLITLGDKQIAMAPGQEREAYFILKTGDSTGVRGFGGCNNFFGTYTLSGTRNITFNALGMTKMYCQGVEYETDFMKALDAARSYSIANDVLTLINSAGAPVATFHAVFMR